MITGTGERAFCTGADLKRTLPTGGAFAETYFQPYDESVQAGHYVRAITLSALDINKPLIAAVNGHALGGGAEIALDCDIRIASTSATFGLPEARWASVPAVGGVSKLLRAIPRAVAMQMLLTGDRIDATEAHRVGLVSEVVAPDELVAAGTGDRRPHRRQWPAGGAQHQDALDAHRGSAAQPFGRTRAAAVGDPARHPRPSGRADRVRRASHTRIPRPMNHQREGT